MTLCSKKSILILAVIVAAAGCSKKPDATASTPPPADATAAATPAPAPAPATPVVVQDVNQSLIDVDTALRARAYDKAVQTMLAVQQKPLTDEQARAAASQMRGLQANLAQAIVSGDPAAKAAMDQLRLAHSH